jgi:phosphate-selective porin OprO/OprP
VGTRTAERFENTAWQVEASYFLTGEENSFKYTSSQHVDPANPLRLDGKGWGAFELVARVQQMSLDRDIFKKSPTAIYATSTSARDALAWGVGVNWYLNTNVKLNLDYESTTFKGGVAGAGSVTGQPEHAILSRVQFQF